MNKEFIDKLWEDKKSNKEYELIKTPDIVQPEKSKQKSRFPSLFGSKPAQESEKPIQNERKTLGKLKDIIFRRGSDLNDDGMYWWYIDLKFTNIVLTYTLTNISGEPPAKYVDASIAVENGQYKTVKFHMLPNTIASSYNNIFNNGVYTYGEYNSKKDEEYILDKERYPNGYKSEGLPTYLTNASIMPTQVYELIKQGRGQYASIIYKDNSSTVDGVTNYTLDTTDMINEIGGDNSSTQQGGKRHRKRKSTKLSRKHRAKRTRGRKSRK